jgi:hypothetical protein
MKRFVNVKKIDPVIHTHRLEKRGPISDGKNPCSPGGQPPQGAEIIKYFTK